MSAGLRANDELQPLVTLDVGMPDLQGRTALVTGGASGIGRACAQRLAQAGAAVTVVDLDGEGAAAAAAEFGGRAVQLDLADPGAVAGLAVDVDVLVNNAGLQHVAPLEDFPPEMFERIIAVMLTAPFRLVQAVLPSMYARGWGRVINISSVHGLRASPYKAAYVAAKHGLEGLSKVVALEGAPHGVTSNCICPAYVRTPLVENQIAAQAARHGIGEDAVVEQIMLTEPAVKRLIEPEEVAAYAAFLCTPHAGFITGASLTMDGGWTAR
ncbi:3-hydroxybutyrate dehydrogenase [soil metagenome]